MFASAFYSLFRVVVDAIVTSRRDVAELEAEVLALRRQVQVLERQIKRVRWTQETEWYWPRSAPTSPGELGEHCLSSPRPYSVGIARSCADVGLPTGTVPDEGDRQSRRNAEN